MPDQAGATIHHRHVVVRDGVGNLKIIYGHSKKMLDNGSFAFTLQGLRARRLAKLTGGRAFRQIDGTYRVEPVGAGSLRDATVFQVHTCAASRCTPIR